MCDTCYVRGVSQEVCVLDSTNPNCPKSPPNTTCPGGMDVDFTVSQGYRRVPGDTCSVTMPGAVNLLPLNISCRAAQKVPPSAGGAIFFLVFVVVVIILVLVSWYLAGTNEEFRGFIGKVIPEKYLPDRREVLPNANYQQLGTAFEAEERDAEDDARELPMDDSTSD